MTNLPPISPREADNNLEDRRTSTLIDDMLDAVNDNELRDSAVRDLAGIYLDTLQERFPVSDYPGHPRDVFYSNLLEQVADAERDYESICLAEGLDPEAYSKGFQCSAAYEMGVRDTLRMILRDFNKAG